MTDEQKAALKWLDECIEFGRFAPRGAPEAIKAMLAEPRLPKEPEHAALVAMAEGGPSMETRYRALYAHLTAPKTKKRWGVRAGPQYGWVHFDDFEKAMQVAKIEAAAGKNPITIEHREVPA